MHLTEHCQARGWPYFAWGEGSIAICADALDCLPLIEAGSVAACVTDPPYGVNFDCGWDNEFRGIQIAGDGDTSVRDEVLRQIGDMPSLMFGSWKAPRPVNTKAVLIWDKGTVGMGDLTIPWFPATEEIYVIGKGWSGTRTSPVMRHWIRNEFHPTEKPVSLMVQLIEKCPRGGILDPFAGSFPTALACIRTNRRFIGVEKEPKYFAKGCERITEELKRTVLFDPPPPVQVSLFSEQQEG